MMSFLKRMVSGLLVMGVAISCSTQNAEQVSVSTTRSAIVNGPLEAGYAAAGAMTMTAPNGYYIGNFFAAVYSSRANGCSRRPTVSPGPNAKHEKPAFS